jgi:phosphoglycerate dehydrogenase-like enzyme
MFHVHLTHPPDDLSLLTRYLPEEITITTGEEVDFQDLKVLVSGRPTREQILSAPNLQFAIVPWAGLPTNMGSLMREFPDISVHNLHHNAPNTAEMAVALLLTAAKFIVPQDRDLRNGDWRAGYGPVRSVLLQGRTALILGHGAIGQHVGTILKGFGLTVLATRRNPEKAFPSGSADEVHPPDKLLELLPKANVLIITLPLTEETRGLLSEDELSLLPRDSLLVNVGRGPIVDQWALYRALSSGPLKAAGLDVWWNYPPNKESRASTYPSDAPLHELDNCVMTPHRGGAVVERDGQRMAALAELLKQAYRGEPVQNRVDLDLGY